MTGPVTVVGYASIDLSGEIREFRGVDATSIVTRGLHSGEPGVGGVAHIARAVAATGADTDVVSWVADDAHGRLWLRALEESGCARTGVGVGGTRSPSATMIEIGTGGTICLFDPGDCHPQTLTAPQRAALQGSGVVLTVAPAVLTAAVLEALAEDTSLTWAVKHDDDAYTPELITRILARADVVSFSRGERDYIFPGTPADRVRPGTLLVETRGADGLAWEVSGSPGRSGTLTVEPVPGVDTTGAGDTFVGTLAGLISRSEPLDRLGEDRITALMAHASDAVGRLLRSRATPASHVTQKETH